MSSSQAPEGYKQTEVGMVPEDWEVKDISDLCLLQRGFDITESTKKTGSIPVYSSSGLSYFHNESRVNPPGVVTGRKGILGKVFYIEEPFWPHDTTLWVKDFKRNDPKYLSFFLTYFDLERFDAATSVPTLNRNNLVNISIAVPPLEQQRAIATTLSDIDALIAKLDKLIAKKRHLKTAAMQQLLTGKKRLPGFGGVINNEQLIINNSQVPEGYKQTEVGVIPKDWDIQALGELAKLERGKFSARPRNDPKYFGGDIPFIQTGDVTQTNGKITSYSQTLNQEGLKVSRLFPKDTLFFTIAANIGDLGITSFQTACPDSLIAILPYPHIDKSWLFQALKFRKGEFEDLATQNAQLNINLEKLNPYLLAVPSLEEQQAIATVLSDIDTEITALETRRTKTQAIKQGMMQELLTGKTRLINSE